MVSLFPIWRQFGFQFNSDKLYETSALCGFCFPQIIFDLLWTSIPVLSQFIISFFNYSPENFSLQIFSSSFLIVDMHKSELYQALNTEPIRFEPRKLAVTLWPFLKNSKSITNF